MHQEPLFESNLNFGQARCHLQQKLCSIATIYVLYNYITMCVSLLYSLATAPYLIFN
jgi:hypothetical protein